MINFNKNNPTLNDLILKQIELDKEKYFKSQEVGIDMSAKMTVCNNCIFKDEMNCAVPHELRDKYLICARHKLKNNGVIYRERDIEGNTIKSTTKQTKRSKSKSTNL